MLDNQKKYQSQLSLLFWSNIILMPILLLVLLYLKGPDFGNIEGSLVFERYAIILTLIGIPIALKWHHTRMQKIRKELQSLDFGQKYLMSSLLRILMLDLVIVINLIGFYLFEGENFIYMSIITIFALFFTFPNKSVWENEEEISERNDI